jgi:hypothetical protein
VLDALRDAPRRDLSIEGIMHRRFQLPISIFDPEWHTRQPDTTTTELAELVRLTRGYEQQVVDGARRSRKSLAQEADAGERERFVRDSAAYLRAVAADLS